MPATRHPACCPLASPLPDSAVLAVVDSGPRLSASSTSQTEARRCEAGQSFGRRCRDGSDFLGDDVGRIVAQGSESKITTERAGPIGDQPVMILGLLSPPGAISPRSRLTNIQAPRPRWSLLEAEASGPFTSSRFPESGCRPGPPA